jgi:hypothetical protein
MQLHKFYKKQSAKLLEKKDVITVSGTEKDLMNWLTSAAGYDKKQAKSEIKSGKRVQV